jgi:hypothetical protein
MRAGERGLAVAVLLALGAAGGAAADDRLERVRAAAAAAREAEAPDLGGLYGLLDAEILDSLSAGGPFATAGFVQERLDALAAGWGSARFQLLSGAGSLRGLGVFALGLPAPGGAVRVYADRAGGPRLVQTLHGPGAPRVAPWPGAAGSRWLVAWEGAETGHGRRAVSLELWRAEGDGLRRQWRLADEPVTAAAWRLAGGELLVRYAPPYPGWKPGCPVQTEHEDRYRASGGGVALAGRRVLDGWHRELGAATARLLRALAAGDAHSLAELVPDPRLRRRLPAGLEADDACDTADGSPPAAASVAAVEPRAGRRVPWSLEWRRAPRGWRLTGADRVLQ